VKYISALFIFCTNYTGIERRDMCTYFKRIQVKNITISFAYILFFSVLLLLGGCSGITSGIVVDLSPDFIPDSSIDEFGNKIEVEVYDIRESATLERTSLGAYLDDITLHPSESELVRGIVERALVQYIKGLDVNAESLKIFCGIKTFDVITPSTPLYWDVTTRIEVVLRVESNEKTVSGQNIERTWIWPSEEMITRVTTNALDQLSQETIEALPELVKNIL